MKCLDNSSANIVNEEMQLTHLGRTSLDLLIEEDAPRKIALIRENMLITDQLPGFWQRVPARLKDFAGLLEVKNRDGMKIIRSMEPPRHDALNVDLLSDEHERKKGRQILEKLSEEVKKYVERSAGSSEESFGRVDFMTEFFADEAGDDRGEKFTDEIDPNGNFILTPKAVKLAPVTKITLESELEDEFEKLDSAEGNTLEAGDDVDDPIDEGKGGAGVVGGSSKTHNKEGENHGDGSGGTGSKSERTSPLDKPLHPVQFVNVRIIKLNDNQAKVFFTASDTANTAIRVHEVGSDFDEPFDVTGTSLGQVINGAIRLEVTKDKRTEITISLSRKIIGGLKLVASILEKIAG
jgi:hypothetical protein